jgi:hypothetical protein
LDVCSSATLKSYFGPNGSYVDESEPVMPYVLFLFLRKFLGSAQADLLKLDKWLLITDLPYNMHNETQTSEVYETLNNYNDYKSGAPLTVIAIGGSDIANSYASLFPPTQMPNLYHIEDISINTTINFCLNSAPWLGVEPFPTGPSNIPNTAVWFYYVFGAAVITAIFALLGIILERKRRKRREILRQVAERMAVMVVNKSREAVRNRYEHSLQADLKDPWEVALPSIDIDYTVVIGKGAFSEVYSGMLAKSLQMQCLPLKPNPKPKPSSPTYTMHTLLTNRSSIQL